MAIRARDVSNYTTTLTPELLEQWKADGWTHLVIQAFPPSYRQYTEQQQQTDAAIAAGMTFSNYIYDYLGDPTWRDSALSGIVDIGVSTRLWPHDIWLDEEDTETLLQMNIPQRIAAVWDSVQQVRDSGMKLGGIYTGRWWWQGYLGDTDEFSTYHVGLWAAQYDGIEDASKIIPFGGWTTADIKQYAGTQPDGTDLNVLSEEESAELEGVSCDSYKAAIERAVNRLQIELEKRTATGRVKTLDRSIVTEIQSELFQALQA